MKIRKLEESDIAEVARLEKELYPLPWSAAAYEESLRNPCARLIVLREDERLIGCGGVFIASGDAEIARVGVAKSYQGRGYGKALLAYLIKLARDEHCDRIVLEARVSNTTARKMYEAAGFKEIITRKSYYDDGEDAVLMIKKIEG